MRQETDITIEDLYAYTLDGVYSCDGPVFVGLGNTNNGERNPRSVENGQVLYIKKEIDQLGGDVNALVERISLGLDYFLGDCSTSICPQTVPDNKRDSSFAIGEMTMRYLSYGSESISFTLEHQSSKFVVKTNQNIVYYPRGFNEYPFKKDYLCEMIVRQFFSRNYYSLLQQNNIIINPTLIGTQHFSVERYIEGNQASEEELPGNEFRKSVYEILRRIEETSKIPIWIDQEPDVNKEGFIIREDGLKVWIDPFVRYRELRKYLYE